MTILSQVDCIEPISEEREALVVKQTGSFVKQAEGIFQREFAPIDVAFDLIGSTAGMFRSGRGETLIRYNPYLFAKFWDENYSETVPHEVAHYIVAQHFGERRVKPHGSQWRALMSEFGVEPRVTGNYDLSGIPQRRQQRFPYHCDCQLHELSAARHNKILRGRGRYYCVSCKVELRGSD